MKKLLAMVLALAMVFALCACGSASTTTASSAPAASTSSAAPAEAPAAAPEAKTYEWKLAMPFNEGTSNYQACVVFAEKLNELSGGTVVVDLFPGNSLGTTEEVEEGLAYGTCDVVYESVASLGSWSALANIDAFPYIYSSLDHFLSVWQGELGDQIREEIGSAHDFTVLGTLFRGARVVTSTKPVYSLADVNGLKIRTPTQDMYVKSWEALGASSTPLPMADVFTALQQGTVDAQENPVVDSYNFGFYDVCDYVVRTNHVYAQCTFIFNRTAFNALPEEVQGWVKEAVKAAEDYKNNYTVEEEAEYLVKWEEAGATIVEVDITEFQERLASFGEDYFPDLVEYVNQIKAMDPAAA